MSDKALSLRTTEINNSPSKFAARLAAPSIYKSISSETRRAYKRLVTEFFVFAGNIHPERVESEDVLEFSQLLDWVRKASGDRGI